MSNTDEIQSADNQQTKKQHIWHWITTHKLISILAVLVALGLGHYWLVHPADNPRPEKKLTVRGSFPYDKGWDLAIDVSYYSKNPICKQTARAFFIFPQAEEARGAWRSLPVIREGDKQYRFDFFEDAVLPGFCEWTLRFVNYTIYEKGREIQGGAILGFPGRYNTIRYHCTGVKMPRTNEIRVGCFEGNDHWKDESRQDHMVDFVWEESTL